MKTQLVFRFAGLLILAVILVGADAPLQARREIPTTPEGLGHSDWSGIRGAFEKHRHAVVANSDGTFQARNPGQAWLTKFDGHGFTVTPDSGFRRLVLGLGTRRLRWIGYSARRPRHHRGQQDFLSQGWSHRGMVPQ